MTVVLVSSFIGICLAGAILYLVRRDHLHGSYASWWLAVAGITLILGVFPQLIDELGHFIGIYYPPILPIIVGMAFILIRMLQMDVDRSRQERNLRRLTQRIAILDQELSETREKLRAGGKDMPVNSAPSVRKSAQLISLPKSSGES
jgi:hypothetical protein